MNNKCKECYYLDGNFDSGLCMCMNENLNDDEIETYMVKEKWLNICPGFKDK